MIFYVYKKERFWYCLFYSEYFRRKRRVFKIFVEKGKLNLKFWSNFKVNNNLFKNIVI